MTLQDVLDRMKGQAINETIRFSGEETEEVLALVAGLQGLVGAGADFMRGQSPISVSVKKLPGASEWSYQLAQFGCLDTATEGHHKVYNISTDEWIARVVKMVDGQLLWAEEKLKRSPKNHETAVNEYQVACESLEKALDLRIAKMHKAEGK